MPGYNFTDDVGRALQAAREEAFRLRHDDVQPVHIVLGLLRNPSANCTAALKQLGVEPSGLSQAIAVAIPPPLPDPIGGPDFPYTNGAKRVLELSMEVARNLGHGYVATEHLLLAVLSRPGELTKLMEGAGVTFDSFGSAIRELGPSEKESSMELGMSGWSVHGSLGAMKWLALLFLSSRVVGWLALVIAVIALILAIRAQP
jgi:ATP-dependent Clp protease ATP-binding subunit ClpA